MMVKLGVECTKSYLDSCERQGITLNEFVEGALGYPCSIDLNGSCLGIMIGEGFHLFMEGVKESGVGLFKYVRGKLEDAA